MGATNCPETPRQKMISMMYLVYTALLALNVSVQILDGYKLVQNSLKASITIADDSKKGLDKSFAKEYAANQVKFEKSMKSYKQLNDVAEKTYKYIDEIKHAIIKGVDGADADTLSNGGLGELNIPSVYWKQNIATSGESNPGKLQKAVEEFRDAAIKACKDNKVSQSVIDGLNNTFKMEKEKTETGSRTWEARIFEDMPAVACMTMLTKTQNDIRNTQVQIGKELLGSADQEDVRVNKMSAVVVSNTGYVMRGGKYESRIILAAVDSTKTPDIYVGGTKLGPDGKYTAPCGSVGNKTYTGYIAVKQKDGTEKKYDFKGEYMVGEPSATISPEMLNVVYAAYPNPIGVSCSGVDNSNLSVSFTNASVQKSSGGVYTIIPRNPGSECVVSVTAKIEGKSQNMGSKKFRILPLPPPLAFLKMPDGSLFNGGNVVKGKVVGAKHVVAELNSDLLKNVKYTVLSFDMKFAGAMGMDIIHSNSSEVTSAQTTKMKSLTPGKTFYISGTQAKGPDGKIHRLPAIEVNIK